MDSNTKMYNKMQTEKKGVLRVLQGHSHISELWIQNSQQHFSLDIMMLVYSLYNLSLFQTCKVASKKKSREKKAVNYNKRTKTLLLSRFAGMWNFPEEGPYAH